MLERLSNALFRLGDAFNIVKVNHTEFKDLYKKDDYKAIESDWNAVGEELRKVLYDDNMK